LRVGGQGGQLWRMVKLVLMHKAGSGYEDVPEAVYDFPARYLRAVQVGVGDWAVYYEPVKAGPRGYFAVARIDRVVPKPGAEGRFLALMAPGSYLEFDRDVPRQVDGRMLEAGLAAADGSPLSGGTVQSAVRRVSDRDFARIVGLGLPVDLIEAEARQYDPPGPDIGDRVEPFDRPVIERLTSRPYRDVAFRRRVRAAYDYRCAVSGLRLRNGGGRPEVQAAHIRPVEHQGSDCVRNGLALSGTVHWMFDRGLIGVAEDMTILVSRNKVPAEVVARLVRPEGRLFLPQDRRDWPHRDNLSWHRENVFGQLADDGALPWA
jgi:putative restriction endonuclease